MSGIAERVVMTRLKDGVATVVLDATGVSADDRAQLERRVRAALIGVPGVADIRVAMTAERLERTIVGVASGKGGVGKSTVSANLAVALARMGKKVGLVDADIYGPSQPRIMGQPGRPEMIDDQIVPLPAHGVRMLSIGQLIEPGTAVAWRGPMTASALSNLMEGDWGDCEYLIVDMPPGTGDVQLTLSQKVPVTGAVIVTTPQDIALLDARKGLKMFEKVGIPILGIVENMSVHVCSNCGHAEPIFGAGGGAKMCGEYGVDFLGALPLTMSIREQADSGRPTVVADPDGKVAAIYREIARKVAIKVAEKARDLSSKFPSIVIKND
jgi:ATP-binding protein involved in chromosome partitioning